MLRIQLIVLLLMMSFSGYSQNGNKTTVDSIPYSPQIDALISEIDTNNILDDVRFLSSLYSRRAGSPGNDSAAAFILNRMQQFNVTTIQQQMNGYYDTVAPNVIGIKTGTVYPDIYVVVGAHFDSYNHESDRAPGADDNASGVAGMLEIMRLVNEIETQTSIIFCAFNAEEEGMIGSGVFVDSLLNNDLELLVYLNMDMIGFCWPGEEMSVALSTELGFEKVAAIYYQTTWMYVPMLGVSDIYIQGNSSDHYYFFQNDLAALFPREDAPIERNPYIHTSADTIGTSFNSLQKALLMTQADLAFLLEFAGISSFVNLHEVSNHNIGIYPNPAIEYLTIKGSTLGSQWTIFDLSGRTIATGYLTNEQIYIMDIQPGTYLLEVNETKQLFIKQ